MRALRFYIVYFIITTFSGMFVYQAVADQTAIDRLEEFKVKKLEEFVTRHQSEFEEFEARQVKKFKIIYQSQLEERAWNQFYLLQKTLDDEKDTIFADESQQETEISDQLKNNWADFIETMKEVRRIYADDDTKKEALPYIDKIIAQFEVGMEILEQ